MSLLLCVQNNKDLSKPYQNGESSFKVHSPSWHGLADLTGSDEMQDCPNESQCQLWHELCIWKPFLTLTTSHSILHAYSLEMDIKNGDDDNRNNDDVFL